MPPYSWQETEGSDTPCSNASETKNSPEAGQTSQSEDGSMEKMPGPSKKKRLSGPIQLTKAKTKILLKLDGVAVEDAFEDQEDRPLRNMKNDPAFNSTTQLIKKKNVFVQGRRPPTKRSE